MQISETINAKREERGITVTELSKATGIKYEALRSSLAGNRKFTATEFVEACKALDMTLEDFDTIELDQLD